MQLSVVELPPIRGKTEQSANILIYLFALGSRTGHVSRVNAFRVVTSSVVRILQEVEHGRNFSDVIPLALKQDR